MARQREGDNATFHFIDNVARAIKYTGKILVDLIPKIYDTERVVRILGEDGNEDKAHIDPKQPQAYNKTAERDPTTGAIKEIYNPSVGRYDVIVTVGPSYGTKRQEAFQALTEMASRDPTLMQKAGDLVMKSADFPMAEELAERLKPPGIEDDSEMPPEVRQQMQQLKQQVEQMGEALVNAHKEVEDKDKDRDLEWYNAETNRLKVVGPAMGPEDIVILVKDTLHDILTAKDPDDQQQAMPPPAQPPDQMQPPQQTQPEPAPAGIFSPEQTQ